MSTAPITTHIEPFITSRSYASESARQRRVILSQFARTVGDGPPDQLTAGTVLDWWQSTEHLQPNSRKAHLCAVRAFMTYLLSIDEIASDRTAYIATPRVHARPPVVLTETQILAVLRHATTVRDQAAVALMLGCALRSSDVAALRVENIDLSARLLTVRGKGNVTRLVPMPVATVACVLAQMRYVPSTGPLIRKVRGVGGVAPSTVRVALTDVLRRAGVKQSAYDGRSPHVFRRTCATVLLESGASIRDVQAILGHASTSSTMPYLARPDAARLVKVIDMGPLSAQEWPVAA